jgi:lipid II:glycine glycyltransferase (peptidoglycan interpeptide bridge formation enzyme)
MKARLERVEDAERWNQALLQLPDSHILQSWQWGEFKSQYGWRPQRWLWRNQAGDPLAAAQLLIRSSALGLKVAYCPRGPLVDFGDPQLAHHVIDQLQVRAREAGALFLKIDPALPIAFGEPDSRQDRPHPTGQGFAAWLDKRGWHISSEQIQYANTLLLDLQRSEEALLKGMKQKTRYNIRLAARKGVTVRTASVEELPLLYRMYAETALRDGFTIRHRAYYLDLWGRFQRAGLAQGFLAQVEGQPVAGLVLFRFGPTAWYFFGMSTTLHRQKMPNHLLQWEAIRWAKAQGCTRYDFWGAPDHFNERDPMWGVYRFKVGFGAQVVRTLGAWDYPLKPNLYRLYHLALPRALGLLRLLGHRRTQSSLSGP